MTPEGGWCLCTPLLLHYRTLVSHGRELIYLSSASIFTSGVLVPLADTQRTPLNFLALVASRTCLDGFNGTITNGKTVLGWLPPPGHTIESRQIYTHSLSESSFYLLVIGF